MESAVLPWLLSVITAWLAVGWLAGPGARLNLLDHPTERSLHQRPTPRSGGIGVWIAVCLGLALAAARLPPTLWPVAAGAAVLALVSLLDDLHEITPLWRLLIHLAAGAAVVPAGLVAEVPLPLLGPVPAAVAAPATVLAVVWMINLYNFMDGMDGFAGGMAVVGFSCYALLGLLAGSVPFALASGVFACAALGFLAWNFPPARIFLGDVGSTLFGYAAAVLALWAAHDNLFPIWVAAMVFFPFIADASVTLARRTLQGEPVWKPHRSHYYQRLVLLGWGHRKTVLTEYALMLGCAATALLATTVGEATQALLLAGLCLAAALSMRAVSALERQVNPPLGVPSRSA